MEKRYYNITMVQETIANYGGFFDSIEDAIANFDDITYQCDHISTTFGSSRISSIEESTND